MSVMVLVCFLAESHRGEKIPQPYEATPSSWLASLDIISLYFFVNSLWVRKQTSVPFPNYSFQVLFYFHVHYFNSSTKRLRSKELFSWIPAITQPFLLAISTAAELCSSFHSFIQYSSFIQIYVAMSHWS